MVTGRSSGPTRLNKEIRLVQHLDIIFFAIVAVILGWKLFSILGRRTGHERRIDPFARQNPPEAKKSESPQRGRTIDRPADRDEADAPIPIGSRRPNLRPVESRPEPASGPGAGMQPRDRRQLEAEIAQAPDSLRQGLEAIRRADPSFNPVDFVAGAKIAFEMILGAFAEGDAKALQPLLGREVLESFTAAIEERRRHGHRLKTTLVGITRVEIAEADLKGKQALVTLKITSEQIDVTEDAAGQVIEGDPARVDTLVDLWTFARDTGSSDPNWQLVATQSPG